MNRARLIAAVLGALLLLMPASLPAQSVFSLDGPGVGGNSVGARARGMGGAELALGDSLRGAALNPALTCLVKQTTLGVTLIPQVIWARDEFERRWWTETSFSMIKLQVPVRPGYVLATGLRLDRSRRAEIRWSEEYDGTPVDLRLKREGDEFVVPLTFALGERHGWSLAAGVDYLFVSLREELSWEIEGDGFSPTSTVVLERLAAPAPLAAVSFSPAPWGRLSFLYRHRATLTGDRELSGPTGLTGVKSLEVRYPSLLGVGGSVGYGRFLLAADVLYEAWDDYREEVGGEEVATSTENTITWGVGLERSGNAEGTSFWGRRTGRNFTREIWLFCY